MTNNKQQTPHGFCETPEQKCTMNYCDENGCQNRKRTLAEPTEMLNNKQHTAVDILCGKLAMKLGIPQAITFYIDHQEEIREAKEMHKEEMVMFVLNVMGKYRNGDVLAEVADQYYNETYGGGE
jgi:hypothetical protein